MHKIEIGKILGEAFSIYGKHWQTLLGLSASIYVLLAVILAIVVPLVVTVPILGIIAGLVGFAISILASVVLQGMFVLAIDDLRDGTQDLSFGQLYERALPFLGPLLLTGILVGLGVLGGLILLIIPGIILAIRWSVTGPIVVLEGVSGVAALRRSVELVKGNGMDMFGLLFVTGLLLGCVNLGIGYVLAQLVSGEFATAIVKQIPAVFTAPISASVTVLAYFALRGDTRTGETPIPAA
jgi:hypothetical protein